MKPTKVSGFVFSISVKTGPRAGLKGNRKDENAYFRRGSNPGPPSA